MSIYYISFYNAESDNHGSFLSKQVLLWSFLSSLDNLFQICLGNGLVGSLNFSKYISKISVLINAEFPTLYTAPASEAKTIILDEFMKHIYKVPGTNKQIIKKFARIGEASIIYSIGRHRFIELARAAGATYKINEGTGGTVLINLEIFDNYMEQFRQPARPLKEPLYGQEEGELNE